MTRHPLVAFGLLAVLSACSSIAPTSQPRSTPNNTTGDAPNPAVSNEPASVSSTPAAPREPVPLFANLGSYQRPVTTTAADAQSYFDQGLRLVWAFNHDEAIRAFTAATVIDPNCAMCFWGIALAHGPNINLPMDPPRGQAAFAAAQKALALRETASANERALIEAMAKRYEAEPRVDRVSLDQVFANAMRVVVDRFPDDPDAGTLFADALLNLRPWDQWALDGTAKPGTLEAVTALESVLLAHPDHPGANHLYIHAVEASPHPERALPAADRLAGLMPGAGHLVHMPSHIYIRTGRYEDAAAANRAAIEVDNAYFRVAPAQGFYAMAYAPHNVDFLRAAAAFSGRSMLAFESARQFAEAAPPEMIAELPDMEMATAAPILMSTLFGRWSELLTIPEPPADWYFTRGCRHLARGLAHAASGDTAAAASEHQTLVELIAATPEDRTTGFFYTTRELLAIAETELRGALAVKTGDLATAITAFEHAVELQDALRYSEPAAWYRPIRQPLGKALLAAGRPGDAERVYREDLRINPENGWSLFGLAQALRAQGKEKEAAAIDDRFNLAWRLADVTLTASSF